MNTRDEEINFLKKRVAELEKQLENLRLSRRVLMDLLEQLEKEKKALRAQLEKKAKDLRRQRKIFSTPKTHSTNFELYEFNDYIKK